MVGVVTACYQTPLPQNCPKFWNLVRKLLSQGSQPQLISQDKINKWHISDRIGWTLHKKVDPLYPWTDWIECFKIHMITHSFRPFPDHAENNIFKIFRRFHITFVITGSLSLYLTIVVITVGSPNGSPYDSRFVIVYLTEPLFDDQRSPGLHYFALLG